ncbi:SGNH/GDSL hydrolase family protein [Francisella sp. 19X1-34]|uniref:SGNH/GDSL hydrolase family protein n=1 Tax=Francisella sp. 19X1-34 TaxID=3087177 RepID=UPI002E32005D|nr:SGNH/GDSL hydrolase family protein [Francisella sp. 19X1-34]MED7788856.1 SGNH/GDSL hydrolase family protein [Francisella sp. 19X1-34]
MLRNIVLVAIIFISFSYSCFADRLQNIVIFGDSLSDAGYANNFHNIDNDWPTIPSNSKKIKQATYSSPDAHYTVWPQYLGINNKNIATPNNLLTFPQNINRAVKPFLKGNDYAAGGATTICKGIGEKGDYIPPPIGPLRDGENCMDDSKNIEKYNQIDSYLKQHNNKANPNTIYIIWGGANNAFLQLQAFTNNRSMLVKLYFLIKYSITGSVSPTKELKGMDNAAKDIVYDVNYLIRHGAKPKNIYVINLPDLGIIPIATDNGKTTKSFKTALFDSLSTAFNDQLRRSSSKGINIINSNKFFKAIVKNKEVRVNGVEYTFSNVTQSACDFKGSNALTCIPKDYNSGKYNKYLFAGKVHPTSYTHQVLAKYIASKIS